MHCGYLDFEGFFLQPLVYFPGQSIQDDDE
jgi:hypothetical protein